METYLFAFDLAFFLPLGLCCGDFERGMGSRALGEWGATERREKRKNERGKIKGHLI
jgi:hypothetical protein